MSRVARIIIPCLICFSALACENFDQSPFQYKVWVKSPKYGSYSQLKTGKIVVCPRCATEISILNQPINQLCNDLFNCTRFARYISIIHCGVHDIGADFMYGQDIETLRIQDNSIEVIKKHTFRRFQGRVLDLGRNFIKILESDAFFDLPKLQQLYLNQNEIEYLNPGAFQSVPNLQLLSMNWNRIVKLESRSFEFLMAGHVSLDFRHNYISAISRDVFENMGAKVVKVCLGSNLLEVVDFNIFTNHTFALVDMKRNRLKDLILDLDRRYRINVLILDYNLLKYSTWRNLVAIAWKSTIAIQCQACHD